MPVLYDHSYTPPFPFKNRHIHTIYPTLFRRIHSLRFRRRRVELPDGDFIDLDESKLGSDHAVIICHGLEGSSDAHYVRGMARAFNGAGWDAIAFNFRGCGGETNRLPRFYHSGSTEDLDHIVRMVAGEYARIALVGFSLGGNLILKYLGEKKYRIPKKLRGACAISVPSLLESAARELDRPGNFIYTRRFLFRLRRKIREKSRIFPDRISEAPFRGIRTLREFDDRYTAPRHGFTDAIEYWTKSSSKQFLKNIRIPTCIINSLDDPFLGAECHPIQEAKTNRNLTLILTDHGGHVGFLTGQHDTHAERLAVDFIDNLKERSVSRR
jgi:hypothetical protein